MESIIENIRSLEYEIIVVDNNSSDDSILVLREKYPQVTVITNNENLGFSKANNIGVSASHGAFILILNPDTVIIGNAVDILVERLRQSPDIGIMGPKIYEGNGREIDITCKRRLPTLLRDFLSILLIQKFIDRLWTFVPVLREQRNKYYNISEACECLSGSCMLFAKETFTQLSGFDESIPMYLDDIDICYRSQKARLRNFYLSDAIVIHVGQYSTKRSGNYRMYDVLARQAHLFYYRKHYGKAVEFAYKAIIAVSIPYLLARDVVCAPYFVLEGKTGELAKTVQRHLKYLHVVCSDKVIDVVK